MTKIEGYPMTVSRYRESADGYGPREYGWKCSCGKRSAWFPTVERKNAAKQKHQNSHA